MFCSNCGKEIDNKAIVCIGCGCAVKPVNIQGYSEKSMIIAFLLCLLPAFAGLNGFHRFYTGKIGTGILMLITLGGFGVWTLIDLIMILTGSYKTSDGLSLSK